MTATKTERLPPRGRKSLAAQTLTLVLAASAFGAVHAQTSAGQGNAPAKSKANAKATASKGAPGLATGAPQCIGEVAAPGKLVLQVGKSTIVRLPEPVTNRTVGNTDVVQAMLVSPQTLYLLGVDVGTTNMILQGRSGTCSAIDVMVGMDSSALQATLGTLMAEEKDIKVTAAADTLVLTGTVSDGLAVQRAGELASAFVRRPAKAIQTNVEEEGGAGGAGGGAARAGAAGGGQGGAEARVINLLNVSAPQQVMLEVKIAEVSKTLLDQLGVGTALRTSDGSWAYSILSNFLSGTAGGILDATKTNGNQLTVEAEKRDGLVRILAEPTVMAISGQEGSFLAGGRILIPVGQSNNSGTTTITLEEKEFGVGLKFTPTVLSGGRINLRVAPEVSELSREGVGISSTGTAGNAVLPLITTRRASTTVQLHDGQSFAIGGLIKNNVTANIRAVPGLGELPVLGALFRSTDFQQEKTELLFVVTPRLVKPLPVNYALPTDSHMPPSRAEVLIGGQLENRQAPAPAPSAPAPSSSAPAPALQQKELPPQTSGPVGFEFN
jgi:pilus assembly protein CpaC